MQRSGFCRNERCTSSAMLIPPRPSGSGSTNSQSKLFGCRPERFTPISSAFSTTMSRSQGSTWLMSALKIVVFPELVAPQTIMFIRERTAAARKCANRSSMVWSSTNFGKNICGNRLRRILTDGRSPAIITADSREPSCSRRSSCGVTGVHGRALMPACAA